MGLQLMTLLMQVCLTAIAFPSDGSAVSDTSVSRRWLLEPLSINPINPSRPSSKVPGDPSKCNALIQCQFKDHTSSHVSPLGFAPKRNGKLVAPPPKKAFHHKWLPAEAADPHDAARPPSIALPPSMSSSGSPLRKWVNGPLSSPAISPHKHHHKRRKFNNSNPEPLHPSYSQKGPSVSPSQSPFPSPRIWSSPASAPSGSPTSSSSHYNMPIFPPTVSPLGSSLKNLKAPPPSPLLSLPPPPPNTDCSSVTCTEPLTCTPTGSPCGCVMPIQVKLHLGIPIYTFFPLVSELAKEIAASVGLNYSQVRIMGADAASQQLDNTAVLVNLVPRGVKFDYITAFKIYDKFWRRQVLIKESRFGAYEVLYVHYPGLPPSPPPAPLSVSTIDDGPHSGQDNNGMAMKPLGVDVSRRQHKGLGKSMIAVIVVSSFTAFVICLVVVWLLLVQFRSRNHRSEVIPQALISSPAKTTGAARSAVGSKQGSESMSFSSGAMTYTGSAKIYSLNEIERATNNFDTSRVLGEGGFGLVYSGTLDDGRKVAVKILKRDNHHGGQEFLAEVEMLSRLHHRNLVKLFGICTEGQTRCLVYELVPNGSVESHLHGIDKEADPLDWDARMKIALGAARGLAYLHEDSNPRVIHRDFKSSNILLEHDFTPKVSDFGLARAALEGNRHISTHVMGTFGYLAPEYAMTGHLLVKSDVYSYGVVLLELLTGRKPVDLSQPPGQENLVAWARPLLTSKEGLETIIDPAIKSEMILLDSVAKVAAIASMCVQPEVSHRPFMGEVVQALKLVCNEFDETRGFGSRCCSQDDFLADDHDHHDDHDDQHADSSNDKTRMVSGEIVEAASRSHDHHQLFVSGSSRDVEAGSSSKVALSTSGLLAASVGVEEQELGSFRRYSSSGPLGAEGRRKKFWQRLRSLSWGSVSEHGLPLKKWPRSR